VQVRATQPIKAGEEILVAYGARWLASQEQHKTYGTLEQQEKDQSLIRSQVYVHGGAAKRWHCIRCKKYLPKNQRLNHSRLCQKVKVTA